MRWFAAVLTFASVLLLGTSASADVVDPEPEDACSDLEEGDACQDANGADGQCTMSTCTMEDYGNTTPQTVESDCLLCLQPDESSDGDDKGDDSGCAVGASPVSLGSLGFGLLVVVLVAGRRRQT